MTWFFFESPYWLLPVALFILVVLSIEIPFRTYRRMSDKSDVRDTMFDTLTGALLGLVAFVLGLSFAQAESRYDVRRGLVITEANAIGTTYLRADVLRAAGTLEFRTVLRDYATTRLHTYELNENSPLFAGFVARGVAEQERLWSIASTELKAKPDPARSLLVQSLNETIDVSSEVIAQLHQHVPVFVLVLTILLVLIGSATIGVGCARKGSRSVLLAIIYAASTVIVLEMAIDLDRPQTGLVSVSLDPLRAAVEGMH